MYLTAVIETHRVALKRILAGLIAMVAREPSAPEAASGAGRAERLPPSLPRRLHRAVLRLLRPAEGAARRLVIVLARVQPPRPVKAAPPAKRKARFAFTLIVRRPGTPAVQENPSLRPLSFPLLDPLPRLRRVGSRTAGVPRICIPGVTAHLAVPARKPLLPDDPLDTARLCRRLAALARVLDDLPGQGRRFARWEARRDRALAAGRIHRVGPLRGGRPPGGRLARYEPDAPRRRRVREVDEILAHAHALAHHALSPDTS